jgi:ABC-2 type transport system permease protein
MRANFRIFCTGVRSGIALFLTDLTPAIYLGVAIPRDLFQALFFVFLAQAAGGSELARFALIGNAVHVAVYVSILAMDDIIEGEKDVGMLQFLIASPSHWFPIMLGRSVMAYMDAAIAVFAVLVVFVPFFASSISVTGILRSIPLIALVTISSSGIGMLVAAAALPYRWANMVGNLAAYTMMVICGVNFPVTALPPAVQAVSNLLPVTHGLLAIRAVIDGASYASVLPHILAEIAIGALFALAGVWFFWNRLYVTRKEGRFELV